MLNRREDAAYQAYCWARFATDPEADRERTEARRVSNTTPETATAWQQWVVRVPLQTSQQTAIDLATMWARVAAVQPDSDV